MQPELAVSRGPATPTSCDGALAAEGDDWWFSRIVVVLAPGDRLDAEALRRAVGLEARQLLMVSVGYPPTPDQRTAIDAGMQLCIDRGIPLQARLAWTMDEALDLVGPLDEVARMRAMCS
jgi:hypothetical protein